MKAKLNQIYTHFPLKQIKLVIDFIDENSLQLIETHDFDFYVKSFSYNQVTNISDYSKLPENPAEGDIVYCENPYTEIDSETSQPVAEYPAGLYIYLNSQWQMFNDEFYHIENLKLRIKQRFDELKEILSLPDEEQIDYSNVINSLERINFKTLLNID